MAHGSSSKQEGSRFLQTNGTNVDDEVVDAAQEVSQQNAKTVVDGNHGEGGHGVQPTVEP